MRDFKIEILIDLEFTQMVEPQRALFCDQTIREMR